MICLQILPPFPSPTANRPPLPLYGSILIAIAAAALIVVVVVILAVVYHGHVSTTQKKENILLSQSR